MAALPFLAPTSRKDLLKKLLATCGHAWAKRPVLPECRGGTRLETPRKVYRFEDGICVEVSLRDTGEIVADAIVGMRIAGWLADGARSLSDTWRPGTSCVLWKMIDAQGNATVACTSQSFAYFHAGNTPQPRDPRDMPTSRFHAAQVVPAEAPAVRPLDPGSMTRMFY